MSPGLSQTNASNNPVYAVFHQVKNFSLSEVKSWAQQSLVHDTLVVSDGLNCFKAVTEAGCDHQRIVVGSKRKSVDIDCFSWINTILGNVKTAITGTYHSFDFKSTDSAISASINTDLTAASIWHLCFPD